MVVNEKAGNGRALKQWQELETIFTSKQVDFQLVLTESAVETRERLWEVKKASLKIKAVIIIGGDGTVHTVIQDIAETAIPIAILPTGSGNDLAKSLKLSSSPKVFAEALLRHQVRGMDVLHVNGSYCITVAAAGMDAEIADHVDRSVYKRWLNTVKAGSLAYVIGTLAIVRKFKPAHADIFIDDEKYIAENVWLLACGNTTSYGGGMNICPLAHPADGLIDITFLHSVSRMSILWKLLPKVFLGTHLNEKGVANFKGKKIMISANRPLKVIADGEVISETPVTIQVKEKGIKILLTSKK
ncbi:diacylglycerol kinase family protein [Bacillus ectoiniformans]|uniref:diacylglycerol/lipid kinase family protein n=1 Tax=Bacillus ectoiniformans TaxID=1494429 RepID=UPI003083FB88